MRLVFMWLAVLVLASGPAAASPDTAFLQAFGRSPEIEDAGNIVDYVIASDGHEQYAAAIISANESTVHYCNLLRTRKGHWVFAAVAGGSVTGIPDVEGLARHAHFPSQVAHRLGQVGDESVTKHANATGTVQTRDPLWPGLHDAILKQSLLISDERTVIDYIIVRSGSDRYAVMLTPVEEDKERLGYWYQSFLLHQGHWKQIGKRGPMKRDNLDVARWAEALRVPAAPARLLNRLDDPTAIFQDVP